MLQSILNHDKKYYLHIFIKLLIIQLERIPHCPFCLYSHGHPLLCSLALPHVLNVLFLVSERGSQMFMVM